MAHNLCYRDGQPCMMYVQEAPWHGLGKCLPELATPTLALKAANLDWTVAKSPLSAVSAGGVFPVTSHVAIIREDLQERGQNGILGIVSNSYTPIQNHAVLDFFTSLFGPEAAVFETAGALGKGEKIWFLARLPGSLFVKKNDEVRKYLLLSNAHDGSASVQIKVTPIRVVCQNTLIQAMVGERIRIPHFHNVRELLASAGNALRKSLEQSDSCCQAFQRMAEIQFTEAKLNAYLEKVFPVTLAMESNQADIARVMNQRYWAAHYFDNGQGNREPGIAGTLWAAYNGVTEYVDHCFALPHFQRESIKKGAGIPELSNSRRLKKLESIWFGEGYQAKARAFRVGGEICGGAIL